MDFGSSRRFAPHPGDAGGGGAVRRSAGDVTDVDRAGVVGERGEGTAALPLDSVGADAGDVFEASLDFGGSAVLSA